ncbi:MAG: hypothetical protein KOO63_04320, partial [Bacteroidales bacterium]|nr:hypothetical protein [Candidatus Latescibacterota bacterium]
MNDLEDIATGDDQYVAIGQVMTGVAPKRLNTILGSCVALMIYHRETGTGGMAHILFPGEGSGNMNSAGPATRHLISEVRGKIQPEC